MGFLAGDSSFRFVRRELKNPSQEDVSSSPEMAARPVDSFGIQSDRIKQSSIAHVAHELRL